MKIEVISSGSHGNCTLIETDKVIAIDCGISLKKIGKVPDICLVTHSHSDHTHGLVPLVRRGTEFYMTKETASEIGMRPTGFLEVGKIFRIGSLRILPIGVKHDVPTIGFIMDDGHERILYLTDAGKVPKLGGKFDRIFIEANFETEKLMSNPDISNHHRWRVYENHLSIEQALDFLESQPQAEVTFLHISRRHGDAARFYKLLEEIRWRS